MVSAVPAAPSSPLLLALLAATLLPLAATLLLLISVVLLLLFLFLPIALLLTMFLLLAPRPVDSKPAHLSDENERSILCFVFPPSSAPHALHHYVNHLESVRMIPLL